MTDMDTEALRAKALDWYATFADLRLAGITLDEWLVYHRQLRAIVVERT